MKFFATKQDYLAFRAAWAKAAQEGLLDASDHLMYNLIRGKAPEHGFTPTRKFTKLTNGHAINGGLADAAWSLRMKIDSAKEGREYGKRAVDLFGGTLTVEQFASLECPKIEPIYSNFGRGKAVAAAIINRPTISWDEINKVMEGK